MCEIDENADLDGLLADAATGSMSAFAQLYDIISPRVHGLALRVIGHHARAEQTTQDIFLDVWRRAGAFDRNRESARTWILTITHQHAVTCMRTAPHGSRQEALIDDEVAPPSLSLSENPSGVPDPDAETIVLAYFDGLSQHEIADQTNAPLPMVKTRMRSGLDRLHTLTSNTHLEHSPLGLATGCEPD